MTAESGESSVAAVDEKVLGAEVVLPDQGQLPIEVSAVQDQGQHIPKDSDDSTDDEQEDEEEELCSDEEGEEEATTVEDVLRLYDDGTINVIFDRESHIKPGDHFRTTARSEDQQHQRDETSLLRT